ncbi:twitch domain-containing radical SAM protein [bacterium]|nr:twitch domain-containing radical SAM protein [bacterium]
MRDLSPTFCIYPWDHLATLTNGSILPCCVAVDDSSANVKTHSFLEAWNSEKMKSLRQDLLAGKKSNSCVRCYNEEACGIESHRVSSNRNYLNMLGSFESLIDATSEDGYLTSPIKSIDLRLANNCNLQCIMCGPSESTKWAADISKMIENSTDDKVTSDFTWKAKANSNDYLWYKDENFWKNFKALIPDIRDLVIGGGEPFLINEQISFLKDCVERGYSRYLSIRFHTNGTVLTDDILELLSKFRDIDIILSLDGVDEHNHYVRYPANWIAIEKNLKKLDSTPNNISVFMLSTMHAISIYYFPQFLRWFMQQNFKKIGIKDVNSNLPLTGIAHSPFYLNPRVLPLKIKASIRKKYTLLYEKDFVVYFKDRPDLKNRAISRLNANLEYMDSEDRSHEFENFLAYTQVLDKTRKTSFSTTFPELQSEI